MKGKGVNLFRRQSGGPQGRAPSAGSTRSSTIDGRGTGAPPQTAATAAGAAGTAAQTAHAALVQAFRCAQPSAQHSPYAAVAASVDCTANNAASRAKRDRNLRTDRL